MDFIELGFNEHIMAFLNDLCVNFILEKIIDMLTFGKIRMFKFHFWGMLPIDSAIEP